MNMETNLDNYLDDNTKYVLLVQPSFPIPTKSRNHYSFLPIGLLKIASYLRSKNIEVKLVNGGGQLDLYDSHRPDLICITSLFTYWSKYVKESVNICRMLYQGVPIIIGGVYASLMPHHCNEWIAPDGIITGVLHEVEYFEPAYDLVDVDFQIIHTTRGCIRNCNFCGVYQVEPLWSYKKSIKDEIIYKKVIFYDNNILANPYIENILNELILLKKQRKINYLESQSGFDGRLLLDKPYLAKMLYEAGFKNPKIAWDHSLSDKNTIKQQINLLTNGGYKNKQIGIFMIYNFEIPYEEMEQKRIQCFKWGVQIMDCRFRPLTQTFDNYKPRKKHQTNKEYYIHPLWTDAQIKQFRRNVRRTNMCIRFGWNYWSYKFENKTYNAQEINEYNNMNYNKIKKNIKDLFNPLMVQEVG